MGRLGNGPRQPQISGNMLGYLPCPLFIVRPSAASSACVGTHSLHRST